jgi:hypothetical protein
MPELRDKQMILNPMRWPLLCLPLKKANPMQEGNCAYFAPPISAQKISEDEAITIRIGTIYDNIEACPEKTYENVDALLADGWRVD